MIMRVALNAYGGIINKFQCPKIGCTKMIEIDPKNYERKIITDCPKCESKLIITRIGDLIAEAYLNQKRENK